MIYSASWDTLGRKNGEWKWICDKKYYAIEKYKKGMLLDSFSTDFKNKDTLEKDLFTHCEKPKSLKKICLLQEEKNKNKILINNYLIKKSLVVILYNIYFSF